MTVTSCNARRDVYLIHLAMTISRSTRLGRLAGLLVSVVLLIGPLASSRPALAAGFVVTTGLDAPHTLPLDGTCSSTIGACTLRAAVEAASFLGGTQTVQFAGAGVYTLTLDGGLPVNGST
jgi:hypothetical protein